VFTTYFDTLVDFGLNALVAREVSRGSVGAAAAFRTVNLLRLGLWLLGLPVVAVVYGPLREQANLSPEAALAGWVFYFALLPSVVAKTASGLLWAVERLELTASVSVVATVFRTALGGVVLFGGFGLVGLAGASLLTNLVTTACLWWLAASRAMPAAGPSRTQLPPAAPPAARSSDAPPFASAAPATRAGAIHEVPTPPPRWTTWLRESWPLFVNQLLQNLFFKVDALLLPGLAGNVAAGSRAR